VNSGGINRMRSEKWKRTAGKWTGGISALVGLALMGANAYREANK